jgi:hypothetical protein
MSFASSRLVALKDRPKSTGGSSYLNPGSLGDGESVRFSPVGSSSLDFFEIWGRTSDGKPKCLRFADEPTTKELNDRATDEGVELVDQRGNPTKMKMALACFVWNYATSSVQLFQASQVSILETLASLFSDEDVAADPGAWDFELTRSGSGMDTRYSVVLKPGKRKGTVKAEVDAAWSEAEQEGYNLEALLSGGDPFKMPF